LTREAAIAEISDNSGSQFDPEIAALFLTLV
jgi:HD-GYP domain-containing protein (c-di-GMP phosphodiesterase class II)